ncbi:MAG TPA: hypothetical protein VFK33_09560 [Bacillales bacterium]|nr:hypothetical protein [Bacillales bacterium]
MNITFGVLSILWGFLILVIFFFKLKDRDFQSFRERNEQVDEGFPLLTFMHWVLRQVPVGLIKGVVLAVGLVFIVGGFVIM